MPRHSFNPMMLAASLLIGFCLSTQAGAATDAASKPAAKAHKKAGAPKFIRNSAEESTKERERRLLRECRGRPNAGACAGFAS